ncbi:AmmeMemoRadiSam system protein B [Pseudomaricurvus alkylphenolicus]|uniref:AmmeMemoRadiSam system protein B n=1 Tax=Pseudomaricurvus alkylphenolicus TaxID=1306991 RepID=UPI001420C2A6|nr:AmmeMemoRadiSam system protein B [Pseudomaricurvus alkylphenolicus]NIB43745.1 AmmeMemoRadiSam system protein B [Pseudomaricurvus alkylphenolicus]
MSLSPSLSIRPAAVAGTFYPAQSDILRMSVDAMLDKAWDREQQPGHNPKALIVPHAGYCYSGEIAASAYARVVRPELICKVLLLGPAHRLAFRGIATADCSAFATPLGSVDVDETETEVLLQQKLIVSSPEAHRREHSLEVQLPFLQELLSEFELLPLLVGDASSQQVADVIDRVVEDYLAQGVGEEEILVLISSDLSHFHDYQFACDKDQRTSQAICDHSHKLEGDEACGCRAINGLMVSRFAADLGVSCIDLRNSGDTAGGRDQVVGYGAFVLNQGQDSDLNLTQKDRRRLLLLARQTLQNHFDGRIPIDLEGLPDILKQHHCSFVTLRKDGQLRGCIGSLRPHQPLYQDVIEHAHAAAFRDHRFTPLREEELEQTRIEISVLSPEQPLAATTELQVLEQLRPGIDGLTISSGHHQATFLPSVWEELKEPPRFIRQLKIKAGLDPDHWPDNVHAWRYQALKILE